MGYFSVFHRDTRQLGLIGGQTRIEVREPLRIDKGLEDATHPMAFG